MAVSQYDNFAIGPNFSDGFTGASGNNFVDDTGDFRTSAWAFDVLNVDSANLDDVFTGGPVATPVPTLSRWMLISLALLLVAVGGLRMRSKRA